jgi:hypothetical protein
MLFSHVGYAIKPHRSPQYRFYAPDQHLLTNVLYGPFKALEAASVTMALASL